MMLDHVSGAQRRASSVTVPLARGRAGLKDCGLALGLSERGRLSARLRAIFFLLLGLRPSLRALAGPFGALLLGRSALVAPRPEISRVVAISAPSDVVPFSAPWNLPVW